MKFAELKILVEEEGGGGSTAGGIAVTPTIANVTGSEVSTDIPVIRKKKPAIFQRPKVVENIYDKLNNNDHYIAETFPIKGRIDDLKTQNPWTAS